MHSWDALPNVPLRVEARRPLNSWPVVSPIFMQQGAICKRCHTAGPRIGRISALSCTKAEGRAAQNMPSSRLWLMSSSYLWYSPWAFMICTSTILPVWA